MDHIIDLYEQATLRADATKQGLRFLVEDRKALVAAMEELKGFNYKDVAHAISRREWDGTGLYNSVYGRHVGRLNYFMNQYSTLRNPEPLEEEQTGIPDEPETIIPLSTPVSAMVQKLVDELVETAVKYGVTSTHALSPYIHRAIEKRKAAQKVDHAKERIVEELRSLGLTREQMLEALAASGAVL